MKALPLNLELTQPTEMAASLEEVLKGSWNVESTQYNAETQVRETTDGVPMLYNGGSDTSCQNDTQSFDHGIVVDLKLDVQIDDLLG